MRKKKAKVEAVAEESKGPEAQAAVDKDVDPLVKALEEKTREAKENYDLHLRTRAEMDNLRKRLEKEKEDHARYGNERLIRELLGVVDNFERALEHADDENSLDSLKGGLKLVYEQTGSVLASFGLKPISAVGEKFDPNVHEAISHEECDGAEPGTVVKEFQKGYFLKDRLLRPSMVSVAKEPSGEGEDSGEE